MLVGLIREHVMICVISINVEINDMSSFVSIDIVRLHCLSYKHLIDELR